MSDTAPTERELLQEARELLQNEIDWRVPQSEADEKLIAAIARIDAHLAERPGEAVEEIVPLKSEHWIKRLATMYGCRQMAMLRGDAAGKKHCTFWLMQIADEHWHEIVNTLQSATPAEPARGTVEPDDFRLEITREEVTRIRNTGCGNEWPKVWNRQLNNLCDAYEALRAMLAARNG